MMQVANVKYDIEITMNSDMDNSYLIVSYL